MAVKGKPIRSIMLGGIFFLLPLLAAIVLFGRGIKLLLPLAHQLVDSLGIATLFGAATVLVVCVLLLLIVCYLSGLLLTRGLFSRWNSSVEEKLFLLFPGFQMLKYQLLDDDNVFIPASWKAVLLEDDKSWRIAFITNRHGEIISLYIPDAPRIDAGELRYTHERDCNYLPVTMKDAMRALINFGHEEVLIKNLPQAQEP